MSRRADPRGSDPNLAYGDSPQRWDRDRFEGFGRGPPPGPPPRRFEEDYRYTERDRPGRQDVAVQDRIQTRGPGGRFEERDRFVEEDRYSPARPRRRTDKELFGDVDPREIAEMALTPYKSNGPSRMELDIQQRSSARPPRPGLLRRQSSLDTFDRRPIPRYEREEIRIPTYTPVPQPIRRQDRWGEEDEYEKVRYRDYEPEDYREVEIQRERSVHRRRPKSEKSVKSSKAKSVTTTKSSTVKQPSSSSSSSSESFEEVEKEESVHGSVHPSTRRGSIREKSIHESFHESFHESEHGGGTSISESIQQTEKKFKKGKTKMPKRLVRREAIMDLGYPFYEEDDFFFLTIALEKEQIDEVMRVSEVYKSGDNKRVYKYEERIDEAPAEPQGEREEVVRTEWINPPTVVGSGRRAASHSGRTIRASSPSGTTVTRQLSPTRTERTNRTNRTARSRHRPPPGDEFFEERKTVIEERSPPPPPPSFPPPPPEFFEERKTVIEERAPSHIRSPSHGGTLVLQEREYRSDRDIQGEIARLEAERRALRLEREAEERRGMAVRIRERPEEDFQLVEYREHRPRDREILEIVEREKEPPKTTVRVEKDRKERRPNPKLVAAAMATLT